MDRLLVLLLLLGLLFAIYWFQHKIIDRDRYNNLNKTQQNRINNYDDKKSFDLDLLNSEMDVNESHNNGENVNDTDTERSHNTFSSSFTLRSNKSNYSGILFESDNKDDTLNLSYDDQSISEHSDSTNQENESLKSNNISNDGTIDLSLNESSNESLNESYSLSDS
jgi:hypothetical protein